MKIKILCDSMCDIPEEISKKEYLEMIPLTINIDGKEYKDGIDFTKVEFYNILETSHTLPKTSQITYMQFKEAFEKYTNEWRILKTEEITAIKRLKTVRF